jgi:hypothetical protein
VSRSLVAEGLGPVLRNVSARVLQRCNSTMAATQARPEEWHYAKPFEDIPGPKPLPIIGNAWRFIPHIGELLLRYGTMGMLIKCETIQSFIHTRTIHRI